MVYNAQLGVTIDKLEQALKPIQPKETMPDDIVLGRNRYAAQCLVYEYNLSKAYDWWDREIASDIRTKTKVKTHVIKP